MIVKGKKQKENINSILTCPYCKKVMNLKAKKWND